MGGLQIESLLRAQWNGGGDCQRNFQVQMEPACFGAVNGKEQTDDYRTVLLVQSMQAGLMDWV